ncbi:unnamed protein product [Pleuronectes platessa]|uniref:Uncharacterized protein n=1 Tax=Pleuronectes platessa TaxID=8262 RepID=A0A9N7UIQ0_PLEPL|nr:unnamed protein product [Pleuronectes platessa]
MKKGISKWTSKCHVVNSYRVLPASTDQILTTDHRGSGISSGDTCQPHQQLWTCIRHLPLTGPQCRHRRRQREVIVVKPRCASLQVRGRPCTRTYPWSQRRTTMAVPLWR